MAAATTVNFASPVICTPRSYDMTRRRITLCSMAETIVQYAACELEVSVPMLGIQAADHVLAACQQKQAFARVTKASVRARVAELQANAAVNTVVTIERLTAELEEARQLAIARGNASAAVLAIVAKAKLHGLINRDQAGAMADKDADPPARQRTPPRTCSHDCVCASSWGSAAAHRPKSEYYRSNSAGREIA